MNKTVFLSSVAALLLSSLSVGQPTQCVGEWSSDYGSFRAEQPVALVPVAEGEIGPDSIGGLYIVDQDGIRIFDGETIRTLDNRYGAFTPGLASDSERAALYDDGGGRGLAVGQFARVQFRRDGQWNQLPGIFASLIQPPQSSPPLFQAMTAFDDGGGEDLYVSGFFQEIDGQSVRNVARFDGTSWSQVGGGLEGEVHSLHVHDFGSGPRLVAGGRFMSTGPTPIGRVAVFDGVQWTSVGSSPPDGPVRALTTWDDGISSRLIAAGRFATADGQICNSIAAFDGTTWSPLGGGIDIGSSASVAGAKTLIVVNPGQVGSQLVVGGLFAGAGGVSSERAVAFDGLQWLDFSQGFSGFGPKWIEVFASYDFGGGAELIAGGGFDVAGTGSRNLARRAGGVWTRLAPGQGATSRSSGSFSEVYAGTTWDDGQQERLFVGGSLETISDLQTRAIAQRGANGTWTDVGGGLHKSSGSSFVGAMTSYNGTLSGSPNDASGIYVIGGFQNAGSSTGLPVNNVARWDGTQWHALGQGLAGELEHVQGAFPRPEYGLEVFDDGSGPRLFAIGDFQFLGTVVGTPARRIAVWDGATWEALPMTGLGPATSSQFFFPGDIAIYDDGVTSGLYFSGRFNDASAFDIATPLIRWNGNGFDTFPDAAGFNGDLASSAFHLEVFDDGSGEKLWMSGLGTGFSNFFSGGQLAFFDGTTITGVPTATNLQIRDLHAYSPQDGGPEELLMAVDQLMQAPNIQRGVLSYGQSEIELFDRIPNVIFEGPSLSRSGRSAYVGGTFNYVGDQEVAGLCERSRVCNIGDDYCFGDGGVSPGCTPCPCGNDAPAGSLGGCINFSGAGTQLIASGNPSVSNDTLRFEVGDMTPQTLGVLFSGENRLPANAINPCFGLDTGIANASAVDGLRCMGGPTARRHGGRGSDAAGSIGDTTNGWGPPNGPPGGLIGFAGFVAGQTRHFQVFHRDAISGGCGTGVNTSQGVTIQFQP